jgi:putative ABC transport system permease protein
MGTGVNKDMYRISEGYEDWGRFRILPKVGMSACEVKSTIHCQILLVFFLPLLVATVHMAFAFPILTRLLKILFQSNRMLFAVCTGISFVAFALVYVVIYGITARVYDKIVRR